MILQQSIDVSTKISPYDGIPFFTALRPFYDAPGNGNGAGGVNPNKGKTFPIVVNASDGDDFSVNQVLDIQIANIRKSPDQAGRDITPPGWLDLGLPGHVKPHVPGWAKDKKQPDHSGPPDWLLHAPQDPAVMRGNSDVIEF